MIVGSKHGGKSHVRYKIPELVSSVLPGVNAQAVRRIYHHIMPNHGTITSQHASASRSCVFCLRASFYTASFRPSAAPLPGDACYARCACRTHRNARRSAHVPRGAPTHRTVHLSTAWCARPRTRSPCGARIGRWERTRQRDRISCVIRTSIIAACHIYTIALCGAVARV
jgi:hypothetical protein